MDAEWAATKTTTANPSAVVLTRANSLTTEHPEFGQVISVRAPRRSAALPLLRRSSGPTTESIGTVKMYKTDKGFGFVGQDDGGKDVFVHASALARAGLSGLAEGQRVRMQVGQGQKGLEARSIELLD